MRAKKLKVFGSLMRNDKGKYVRTIVATSSQKEAATILRTSVGHLRDYWSITGNKTELATALAKPRVVFMASTSMGYDFAEKKSMI